MDRRSLMVGMAAMAAGSARADGPDRFESGGRPIAVEWFAAAGGGPAPAILLLHGADGLQRGGDRYRLAAGLVAASGIHVALPHYLDRTGESRVSYGLLRERYPVWADTVRDALEWLGRRPGVADGGFGLVGVSLGAALALTVAAGNPAVKAVVDLSGPLPEGLEGRLPPTLILHGEADSIVPVAQARAIAGRLAREGQEHEIRTYPGEGHVLAGAARIDAASRIAGFLGRHLKGG